MFETNLERDAILYVNEGVKVIRHESLGLVLLLREGNSPQTIQRALDTTKTKILGNVGQSNGCKYYRLEEV